MEELIIKNDELINILSTYYSKLKNKIIIIKSKTHINYKKREPQIEVKFFYDNNINGTKVTTFIKESEIKAILTEYLSIKNYTLVDYTYVGNIKNTGYYADYDAPHFEGIKIYYDKNKNLSKKR